MGMGGVRGSSSMGPVLGLRVPGKTMVPDAEMEGKKGRSRYAASSGSIRGKPGWRLWTELKPRSWGQCGALFVSTQHTSHLVVFLGALSC